MIKSTPEDQHPMKAFLCYRFSVYSEMSRSVSDFGYSVALTLPKDGIDTDRPHRKWDSRADELETVEGA